MLDFGIDVDVWPWIWLVVAVVFALVELTFLGGTFILLPFAASAFVASLLAFYDVAVEVQWAVFVLGGAVAFALLYRWARHDLVDELPARCRRRPARRHGGVVTSTSHPTTPTGADVSPSPARCGVR